MTGGTPKGQLFRDLLTSEKPLVLLGAYDALGARLIAQAGGKSLFIGGFSIVEVDTLDEALEWAGRFAAACRCAQEVRLVMDDPEV